MHTDAFSGCQGCDISGLLTFDPESIEPTPSIADDEPRARAVPPQFQCLKALLSCPIEELIEGSEEVKSVLAEIKDQLPVALQVKLWPVVTLSFYGSRVKPLPRRSRKPQSSTEDRSGRNTCPEQAA